MSLININKESKLDAEDVKTAISILSGFADHCHSFPNAFPDESFADKFWIMSIGSRLYQLENEITDLYDMGDIDKILKA